jgi:hypothetical protein
MAPHLPERVHPRRLHGPEVCGVDPGSASDCDDCRTTHDAASPAGGLPIEDLLALHRGLRPGRVLSPAEQHASLEALADVLATVRHEPSFRVAVEMLLGELVRQGVLR